MTRTRSKLIAPVLGSLAAIGLLMASPASARPGKGGPETQPTAEMKQAHDLKKQIAAVELAAALKLTADQKSRLVDVIQEVMAIREEAREASSIAAAEATPVLEQYLAEVQSEGAPSEATLQAVRSLRSGKYEGKDGMKEDRTMVRENLRNILSREQFEAIAKFRPMAAVGPDPERQEAREERREKRRDRANAAAEERGLEAGEVEAVREKKRRRMAKKKSGRTIQKVLLSPEMLEVLSR